MNRRVQLKSFNGETQAPLGCPRDENFWLLIGQTGEVLTQANERSRVLVKFDSSVQALGLICHNEVENALFILESDLSPSL